MEIFIEKQMGAKGRLCLMEGMEGRMKGWGGGGGGEGEGEVRKYLCHPNRKQ